MSNVGVSKIESVYVYLAQCAMCFCVVTSEGVLCLYDHVSEPHAFVCECVTQSLLEVNILSDVDWEVKKGTRMPQSPTVLSCPS